MNGKGLGETTNVSYTQCIYYSSLLSPQNHQKWIQFYNMWIYFSKLTGVLSDD